MASKVLKGIDTSKWQASKVDYAEAKKAGYSFVILRIGCGNTKDKCFEKDYAAAIAAGMLVGVYFYTYATTEVQAVQDATRVLGWLNNRHLDLPVAYDVEDGKQKGTGRKKVNSAMYNAFADRISAKGYKTTLYSGEYFFNNYFDKSVIEEKPWVAKYSANKPSVGMEILIWQYTSDAFPSDFYKKKLDRNYLYGSIEETVVSGNPYPIPARNLKRTYPLTKGNDVKWLQWELNSKGNNLVVDGKFGNNTKKAVQAYQKAYGLKVDGIVGSATRYSMLND